MAMPRASRSSSSLDEDRGVDDAPGAETQSLPQRIPRGHVVELVRLAVGDDRVPGVRARPGSGRRRPSRGRAGRRSCPCPRLPTARRRSRSRARGQSDSRTAVLRVLAAHGLGVNPREAAHADAMPAPAGDEADVGFRAQRTADHDGRPRAVAVASLALRRERRRGVAQPDDLRLRPLFLLSSYSGLCGGEVGELCKALEERELHGVGWAVAMLREDAPRPGPAGRTPSL